MKKIDGVWIPTKMTFRTMKDETKVESTTVWVFNEVKLNQAAVKIRNSPRSGWNRGSSCFKRSAVSPRAASYRRLVADS